MKNTATKKSKRPSARSHSAPVSCPVWKAAWVPMIPIEATARSPSRAGRNPGRNAGRFSGTRPAGGWAGWVTALLPGSSSMLILKGYPQVTAPRTGFRDRGAPGYYPEITAPPAGNLLGFLREHTPVEG